MAVEKVMGGETEFGAAFELPGYFVERDSIQLSHLLVTAYPGSVGEVADYASLLRGDVEQQWRIAAALDERQESPQRDIRERYEWFRGGLEERPIEAISDGRQRSSIDLRPYVDKVLEENMRRGGSSDRFLPSGERLYVDHAHPEMSFPEVRSARDAVRYQKAAQLRMNVARRNAESMLREACPDTIPADQLSLRVYGHNQDFAGHTFGAHENYLIGRDVDPEHLIRCLLPYFVTRTAFTGLGTLGRTLGRNRFQVSQRAMFMETLVGVQTTYSRPIVNTRDEPHADPGKYMRHHVISSDINHNEWAIYLKYGITSLLLKMIEDDAIMPQKYDLRSPVWAMRSLSQDWEMKQSLELENGKRITAPDHLAMYLEDMLSYTASHGATDEEKDVLERFGFIIEGLKSDPLSLAPFLDWPMHFRLIDEYVTKKGMDPQDHRLRTVSLRYCSIEPDHSLFHKLQSKGMVERIVSDDDILEAFNTPPVDTRAYLRGKVVEKFHDRLESVNWEGFTLGGTRLLFNPSSGTKVEIDSILDAQTPEEFIRRGKEANLWNTGQ